MGKWVRKGVGTNVGKRKQRRGGGGGSGEGGQRGKCGWCKDVLTRGVWKVPGVPPKGNWEWGVWDL